MLQHEQTDPPRGRRAWLLMGIAVVVVVLAGGGALTWFLVDPTLGASREDQHQTYQHPVDAVTIDLDGGDITLSAGPNDQVTLTRHLQWRNPKPVITELWSGNTLHIATSCSGADACSTDYDIALPASTAVTMDNRGGAVTSNGVQGALSLSTAGGDVDVADAAGALTIRTGGGVIIGSNLAAATVDARSTGGNVQLDCVSAPTQLTAQSTGGNVDVSVPRIDGGTAGYQVQDFSIGADGTSDVPHDPQGQHQLILSSEGGVTRARFNN